MDITLVISLYETVRVIWDEELFDGEIKSWLMNNHIIIVISKEKYIFTNILEYMSTSLRNICKSSHIWPENFQTNFNVRLASIWLNIIVMPWNSGGNRVIYGG